MAKTLVHNQRPLAGEPTSRSYALDRFVVGCLLFLLAVASAVVFSIATGLLDASQVAAGSRRLRDLLSPAAGEHWIATAFTSALVGLGSSLLLVRRFANASPRPSSGSQHVLVADDRGFVVVSSGGIAGVAETAVVQAGGVMDAEVRVIGRGAAPVRLRIRAWVLGGADLKQVGEDARNAAARAVSELVGIEVQDVSLEVIVMRPDEIDVEVA